MVAAPAAADAVRRARAMPGLRIGLHLDLLDDAPPTDMVRLSFDIVMNRAARREALSEIRAQFESYRLTGLALDHVNAHKHFQLHPVVFGMIAAVGREYGMRAMRVP